MRQPIADAEFRHQDAGPGRIFFDLLAQLAHKDAQIMRVLDVLRTPDLFEQMLVGDHVAGVLRQHLEQPVFLRREL